MVVLAVRPADRASLVAIIPLARLAVAPGLLLLNLDAVQRVTLRAVRALELPEALALDGVGEVLFPGADVKVRQIAARLIVAAVTALFHARGLEDERPSAHIPEQPAMCSGPLALAVLIAEVEEAVPLSIAKAAPGPAVIRTPNVDPRPEPRNVIHDLQFSTLNTPHCIKCRT